MFGATTLIMAISARASLLPTVSIMWAAFMVSSRACSISIREVAISARMVPCSAKGFPKGYAGFYPPAHCFQGSFRDADTSHAVMNSAWPQTSLGNLESPAFSKQHVSCRDTHVFKEYFSVAVRSMIVTEYAQHAYDLDPRRVHGNEDHRLLLVVWRRRVALAHQDRDLASRVAGPGRPPLSPVDNVGVPIAPDTRFDIGGVRGCDIGLRHGEAGSNLAFQQWIEPLLLLLGGPITRQHLHIARVGGRTIENFGADGAASHDLAKRRVLLMSEPGRSPSLSQEQKQIPQTLSASFLL